MTQANHHSARKARLMKAMEEEPVKPIVRWCTRVSRFQEDLTAFAAGTVVGLAIPLALTFIMYGGPY